MGRVHHAERCPSNPLLISWVSWWDVHGEFDIVIVAGDRTDAEQLVDWAKGRKRLADGSWVVVDSSAVVTNALGAKLSAHGHRSAIDMHPVRELNIYGGVASIYLGDVKREAPEVFAEGLRRWRIIIDSAKRMGLASGEDFHGLCDRPHLHDPAWETNPLGPGVAA